jgi:hypothetical protein
LGSAKPSKKERDIVGDKDDAIVPQETYVEGFESVAVQGAGVHSQEKDWGSK